MSLHVVVWGLGGVLSLEARVHSLRTQYGNISARLIPVSHGVELGGDGCGFGRLGRARLVLGCLHILPCDDILSEADWYVGASLHSPQIVVFFHVAF